MDKNGNDRVVAVIGGGPAGCEAARMLALRGFKVTLFEKSNRLGGQTNLAAVPPHKTRIDSLREYYEYILKHVGVDVKYNADASIKEIKALMPYAVFLATGSEPIVPPISGIKGENVCTADSVLAGERKFEGKNVLIVGSGNTGLETAEYLLQFGNKVAIAEMLPQVGMLVSSSGLYTLGGIAANVEMLPGHKLTAIDGNKVEFTNLATCESTTREFDAVVLSLGVKPVDGMKDKLCEEFDKVVVVGDSYQTGNIGTAVKSGFHKAYVFDSYKELV